MHLDRTVQLSAAVTVEELVSLPLQGQSERGKVTATVIFDT